MIDYGALATAIASLTAGETDAVPPMAPVQITPRIGTDKHILVEDKGDYYGVEG